MDKYSYVNQTMKDSLINTKDKIVNEVIKVEGLPFLKLRDTLFVLGKIITVNEAEQSYIATIKSGFLRLTSVVLVIQLQEGELLIAAYSAGAINRQKVCKGAIDELKSRIKQYIK